MKMDVRRIAYLRQHYRAHSDTSLAEALRIGEHRVAALRARAGLERTGEERRRLCEGVTPPAPLFAAQVPLPDTVVRMGWLDFALAGFCGIVALTVYVMSLGPTVTGEDSGELVTAAYTLGVAHPPGYPLWCLIANAFTWLPWGTVAWRVGLMSAVFGAVSVFLVALLVIRCTGRRLPALAGALALAFSGEFWEQSAIAEVYGLNSVLFLACLWLLLNWYEFRKPHSLYLFAVAFGLGLCNHHTMLLQGPVFVFFVVLVEPMFWRRWQRYAVCTVLALSMLSIYLYLPIRSRADVPIDWGDPENFSRFWIHITRQQYGSGAEANPWSVSGSLLQLWAFLKLYAWEFTPWIAWLPLLGAWMQFRREPFHFALLGSSALVAGFGLIPLLNFEIDRQSLWLNNVFWIPAYIICAIWLGIGVAGIATWQRLRRYGSVCAVIVGLAAVLSPLYVHRHLPDKSDYWFAYDYAMNCLSTMEHNALYFPSADHSTFPVLYLQAVEGERPDITIGNKYGYPERSLYAEMPLKLTAHIGSVPTDGQTMEIEDWVIEQTSRPVYFSKPRSMAGLPGYKLENTGLLYRVVRPGEKPAPAASWDDYKWHTLEPAATHGELTADYILSDYYFAQARDQFHRGESDEGKFSLEKSLNLGGRNKEGLNNAGSLCGESGLHADADRYFVESLQVDPEYLLALRNLGKLSLDRGMSDLALVQFERILALAPDDLDAARYSARCMVDIGWDDDALKRYEYLVEVLPNDSKSWRQLGYLYSKKAQKEEAQRCFARSLELDPNQEDLLALLGRQPSTDVRADPGRPQLPGTPAAPILLPEMPAPPAPQLPGIL